MIAKKVPNPKKSSAKAGRAGGLMDYINEPHLESGQEKCVHYEAVNFLTESHAAQKMEMTALSEEGKRSKDPIDHWVLSFKNGERPTVGQAREAVAIFTEHLGVKEHLHVWGMHEDTDNVHIHVGINRVHPETGKVTKINKGFDREAAHQAIALIEKQQGWQKEQGARYDIDLDGKLVKRGKEHGRDAIPTLPTKVRDMELQTGEKSQQRIAQERTGQIMREATSWKDLHDRLAAVGVRYEREGSGAKVYVGDSPIAIKASEVDRKGSFSQLQKRLGAYQPAKEIQSYEYHHHTKKPDVAASRNPAGDCMRRMSQCRMAELGTQGQTNRKGVLHIATRLDRRPLDGLRRNAGSAAERSSAVKPQPLAPGQHGWREYQQIRTEHKAAKEADTLALKQRQEQERKQLTAAMKSERQQYLKGDWRGKGDLRNAMQSVLATQQAAKKAETAERQREEKKALRERFVPLPMYRQWKDQPRIVSIEQRPQPAQQAEREKLSDVLKGLHHIIDKRGHVTYHADGKNLFRDEGRSLSVLDSKSDRAIVAALATAQAKFGNTLTLTGSDEFKRQAVAASVKHGLGVNFSDPSLNQMREQMHAQKIQADREQTQRLAVERAAAEKAALEKARQPQKQKDKGMDYGM